MSSSTSSSTTTLPSTATNGTAITPGTKDMQLPGTSPPPEISSAKNKNKDVNIRKKAEITEDYSSSEDLPAASARQTSDQSHGSAARAANSMKSSSSSSHTTTPPGSTQTLPPVCAGSLELELLGFDHGSSAASSAVGEVSERNIKGGRYDLSLPEWRKGQDFVQPTNIPVRILTDFAIYRTDGGGVLARLEKLPQLDDAYGCYVGQQRTSFVRAGDAASGAAATTSATVTGASAAEGPKVVVSEHTKKLREEQDAEEKKDSDAIAMRLQRNGE